MLEAIRVDRRRVTARRAAAVQHRHGEIILHLPNNMNLRLIRLAQLDQRRRLYGTRLQLLTVRCRTTTYPRLEAGCELIASRAPEASFQGQYVGQDQTWPQ